jgi:hypothetical protein
VRAARASSVAAGSDGMLGEGQALGLRMERLRRAPYPEGPPPGSPQAKSRSTGVRASLGPPRFGSGLGDDGGLIGPTMRRALGASRPSPSCSRTTSRWSVAVGLVFGHRCTSNNDAEFTNNSGPTRPNFAGLWSRPYFELINSSSYDRRRLTRHPHRLRPSTEGSRAATGPRLGPSRTGRSRTIRRTCGR